MLLGRRIKMFRAHIDPHIPPKSRLAFSMGDGQGQCPGEAYVGDIGVLLNAKFKNGEGVVYRDFVIPWANIENVELEPEVIELKSRKKNAETNAV